jgi:hypothetical protein
MLTDQHHRDQTQRVGASDVETRETRLTALTSPHSPDCLPTDPSVSTSPPTRPSYKLAWALGESPPESPPTLRSTPYTLHRHRDSLAPQPVLLPARIHTRLAAMGRVPRAREAAASWTRSVRRLLVRWQLLERPLQRLSHA